MELATIEMERPKARQAFLEYRKAVRERHDAEDEQIMRGYRELAAGKQLIHLRQTVAAGGTTEFAWRPTWPQNAPIATSILPKLAVCRAHVKQAFTNGINQDGSLEIRSKDDVAMRNTFDRVRFPPRTFETHEQHEEASDWSARFRAMVPNIPPPLRPQYALHNYHILWEAEWALNQPPAPRDPALLKHIGGDLYAVLAVWDLTDLERAVLSGRGV
jgi:hypothetical protein